jgi:hypothetical protein
MLAQKLFEISHERAKSYLIRRESSRLALNQKFKNISKKIQKKTINAPMLSKWKMNIISSSFI